MIYLDNAATTRRKPDCVIEAVVQAMKSLGNAGRGAHAASLGAARTIFSAREHLASFFGAEDPRTIVFTMNSTESLNIAIKGTIGPGDHVITTVCEHNSVLRPLYQLAEQGTALSFLGADRMGRLCYDELEGLVRPDTKAIVCTHASNVTGNLTELARVARVAKRHRLLLIVDASQTAGAIPIDVQKLGVDILCFTGHKSMMGPQGTGGMYVRSGVEVRPLLSGGTGVQSYLHTQPAEMPTHLEAGTLNGHGISGLDAAVEFLTETGVAAVHEKETALARRFYEGVRQIPEVKLYGDFSDWNRCPVVSLNIGNYDSSEVSDELAVRFGIATRPGAHCAPKMHETLGTVDQGVVRFSFSYFNTEAEADEAVRAVRILAEE